MTITEKIIGLIQRTAKHTQGYTITAQSELVNQLGYDSLKLMELITLLEDEFDLMIDDIHIGELRTVAHLAALVEEETACV